MTDMDRVGFVLSSTSDEEGRVKTCILEFIIKMLNFREAIITPMFTKDGYYTMGKMFPEGKIPIKIDAIYNKDGSIFISMEDWTYSLNSEYNLEEEKTEIIGKANFSDKYIKVNSQLIAIRGIDYKVPIQKATEKFVIQKDGKSCLYIKNEDGTVDTLLSDIQMKNVKFDEEKKEVIYKDK